MSALPAVVSTAFRPNTDETGGARAEVTREPGHGGIADGASMLLETANRTPRPLQTLLAEK